MKNHTAIWILSILLLLAVGFVTERYIRSSKKVTPPVIVMSFNDCMKAGYPVLESHPRQCKTPDGRTYAEELPETITYTNATAETIIVENPFPGAVTGKEFSVVGKARGTWFFEASFPIEILDKNGNHLANGIAQAQGDWMTTEFVPFKADIQVPQTYLGKATLLLKKDNPSGLPEKNASISFPFTIEY